MLAQGTALAFLNLISNQIAGAHFFQPVPKHLDAMNPFESIADSVGVFGKETSILNRFLFPAPPSSYGWSSFEGELMCVVGREGNIVPCTIMPGTCTNSDSVFNSEDPASTIIIYCHANGEDVGVLYEAGHWLCDTLGVHVLIPEYPGYGMAPGSPNELSVNNNICAAYDFAVNGLHWNPKRVIFFGRSIGICYFGKKSRFRWVCCIEQV